MIDIAPTIYELLAIKPPKVVNGYDQMKMDGTSLAYTFETAAAAPKKSVQFFDNNGSRGIYKDGWFAGTLGPFILGIHRPLSRGSRNGIRRPMNGNSTT